MKISHLIYFSIFFILLLFSITTYINFRQSAEVRDNAQYLSISTNVVRQSNQFQRNILYMERGLRGYLVTGENYFLQSYDSAIIENRSLLAELSGLIPNNTMQKKKLDEIEKLYMQWISQIAEPLIKTRLKDSPSVSEKLSGNNRIIKDEERINKSLLQQFRELINYEYANREKRREILEKSERQTKVITFSLTAISIITGFIIAFILASHISKRIFKMVNMADSIAGGNYQVHVKDEGKDELSHLTKSLNHMANMLEENISLLKRKNKELDQFAHIVSHDLKTPLRGIDNIISWIEEDHEDEIPTKVYEYLKLIKGRINRSENLIQGILTYAKIGKDVKAIEEININFLIKEILETLSIKAGLAISVEEQMPVIYSEKVPLVQIFTNLISNAIKYHDKPKGEIKIYSKVEKNHFEFFVEDDGPGIAAIYHERIFVIFQTLEQRDIFESTGVGLAIVKKILDDRKEKIKIVSQPGKGSTFSFTWSKI